MISPQDNKRVSHLLNLADAAADFQFVDPKLVIHFHNMREELGLAKLLLLIKEYVQNQSRPTIETSQTSEHSQNQTALQ
jgi:hypothetical protein